jgi:Flp pilus assembly protein TadG
MKGFLADCRGVGTVEFALVALAFLGLMLGIIEVGRVLWIANSLHLAVQQAARCGAIASSACPNVPSFAASVAGSGIPSSAFSAGTATCAGGISGYKVYAQDPKNPGTAGYPVHLYVPYVSMNPKLYASA